MLELIALSDRIMSADVQLTYRSHNHCVLTSALGAEEPYEWAVAQVVVGARHWSAELLVDGGWAGGSEPPPRRAHCWRSALLAVALVKWGSQGPRDSKVMFFENFRLDR